MRTYKVAIWALIPLLVASIASPISIASAFRGLGNDLEVLCPALRGGEGGSADGESGAAGDADCCVVEVRDGADGGLV